MTNATMEKFGHPRSAVAEIGAWTVLVRPKQPTLGSLVLVCREQATAFSDLSPQAFADLREAVAGIERVLKGFVDYERINYLMLMMVDPDVHFHVIPRYEGTRSFGGVEVADAGWPGPPNLGSGADLDDAALDALAAELKARWVAA
ncbi:HIT family protein [Chenggangzhangella methanolivorans]|uniref:HIT family protein n=2 Tax=Chenggangzhangella methanolivorans TaxID=1437009 RepID=A0A9E6REZ4_9HYPH|nr:HIT family protein [Chenggangzhangella methanolivorans]